MHLREHESHAVGESSQLRRRKTAALQWRACADKDAKAERSALGPETRSMIVLVTGGAGYIGSHAAKALHWLCYP